MSRSDCCPRVNGLFHENTTDNAYVTVFFAEYDSRRQHLRYANCGHLPGLLLRRDLFSERLDSTGTVLGLFKEWSCVTAESSFLPRLLLYTDGLSEASNEAGEEFGESRIWKP